MDRLLVNGCYEKETLKTLLELGCKRLAFDLRARSPNLVPFFILQDLLPLIENQEVSLIFQNDKISTIYSFLDLLKPQSTNWLLQFRDQQQAQFYHSLQYPFVWMFHPEAEWELILQAPKLKGILLPLSFQQHYQNSLHLWKIVESRNLEVFLHTGSLSEAAALTEDQDIVLSLDLTHEVEKAYRLVDQTRLKNTSLWRNLNENSAVQ